MDLEPVAEGDVLGKNKKYRIKQLLNQGAVGQIWIAELLDSGTLVALKVLRDKYAFKAKQRVRFGREVLALRELRHPHVVAYYDHGVDGSGRPFLVTELVEGFPATRFIGRDPPLSFDQVLEIMVRLASALTCAHDAGIIHRDLKWSNVMIQEGVRGYDLKLIDFGVLKFAVDSALRDGKSITDTGVVVGTPYYCSPEQILGKRLDRRSDVYALGVMVYELLTFERPFVGKTQMQVVLRHLEEEPVPPHEVEGGPYVGQLTPEISKAVLGALVKRPDDRTPTVQAFYKALEAAIKAS